MSTRLALAGSAFGLIFLGLALPVSAAQRHSKQEVTSPAPDSQAAPDTVPQKGTVAPAVQELALDQEFAGQLQAGDQVLPDGSFADLFAVPVTAGKKYRIELQSGDFDAVALQLDAQQVVIQVNDDTPGLDHDTDAALIVQADSETLFVGANTLTPKAEGDYTLRVTETADDAPVTPPPVAAETTEDADDDDARAGTDPSAESSGNTPAEAADSPPSDAPAVAINPGDSIEGSVTAKDPAAPDGTHYDSYTLTVRAGERFMVDLGSKEFDTYLRVENADETVLAACDDFAGTDSRCLVEAPADGQLTIIVNGLGQQDFGNYTLRVTKE